MENLHYYPTNHFYGNYVSIEVSSSSLDKYLKENAVRGVFKSISNVLREVELNRSMAQSLVNIINAASYRLEAGYISESDLGVDKKELEAIVRFLKTNESIIDAEAQGKIELRYSDGEDGFAYLQLLEYQEHHGKLIKWPCVDGWNYQSGGGYNQIQDFNTAFFNGEIPELEDIGYETIYELIWDGDALSQAVEKTGLNESFEIEVPENMTEADFGPEYELEDIKPVNTDWIKGALFVFTGLNETDEAIASEIVNDNGGEIKSSVVLKSNYVVYNPYYGRETTKMKRAKDLIERGKPINLITVSDFCKKLISANDDLQSNNTAEKKTAARTVTVPETVEQVFKYEIRQDEFVITGLNEQKTEITIPGSVDGLPVTLEPEAFLLQHQLEKVIISEGITQISRKAFFKCRHLEEVEFPTSLTKIDSNAFDYTAWLKNQGKKCDSVIVNQILIRYFGNASEYSIPDGVKRIAPYAFYENNELNRVVIPDSVDFIDGNAFAKCSNLNEIQLPDHDIIFGGHPFDGTPWCKNFEDWIIVGKTLIDLNNNYKYKQEHKDEIEIPQGVEVICDDALHYDTVCEAKTVKLPEGLEIIGSNVFYADEFMDEWACGFILLENVKLPSSLRCIGENAFHHTKIKEIRIPSKVEQIDCGAFGSCKNLRRVIVEDGARGFDKNAFEHSNNIIIYGTPDSYAENYAKENDILFKPLSDLPLPKKPKTPKTVAEENAVDATAENVNDNFELGSYRNVAAIKGVKKSVKEIFIPATLDGHPVEILFDAFKNDKKLEKVIIAEGVKAIGFGAFSGCSKLKEVTLPTTLKEVGNYAFSDTPWKENQGEFLIINGILVDCSKKNSVVKIPDGVVEINDRVGAFNCSIQSLTIPDSVKFIDPYAFSDCYELTDVHFPDGELKLGGGAFADSKWANSHKDYVVVNGTLFSLSRSFAENEFLNSSEIVIPDGVRLIEDNTFNGKHTYATKLILPETLEIIGEESFSGRSFDCFNLLEEVVLPSSLRNIGKRAFFNTKIKEITIPSNVEKIDESAFGDCAQLKRFIVKDGAKGFNDKILAGCNNVTIYGSPNSYAQAFAKGNNIPFKTTDMLKNNSDADNQADAQSQEKIEYPDYAFPKTLKELKQTFTCSVDGDTIWLNRKREPAEVVFIPGSVKGKKVVVSSGAFENDDTVKKVVFCDGVAKLESCFKNCWHLEEVIFSDTIEQVSAFAFENTPWKKSQGVFLITGSILQKYRGNSAVVEIPERVKKIAANAFENNSFIRSVIIPDSVELIGDYAFWGCDNLEKIQFPEHEIEFGTLPFNNTAWANAHEDWVVVNGVLIGTSQSYLETLKNCDSLAFPKGIRAIQSWLPRYSKSECHIKEITLPEGLETICGYSFCNIESLKKIEFPSTLKRIEDSAFSRVDITELTIPAAVRCIENYAFSCCCSLEWIIVEDGAEGFSPKAFFGCDLATVYGTPDSYAKEYACENSIPFELRSNLDENARIAASEATPDYSEVKTIRDCLRVFRCTVNDDTIVLNDVNHKASEITIPAVVEGHKVILSNFFCSRNNDLRKVVISEGITEIPDNAFKNCRNLEEVILPDSLRKIGLSAFEGAPATKRIGDFWMLGNILSRYCGKESDVVIPNGVTIISRYAFSINKLKSVVIPDTVKSIMPNAFSNCSNMESIAIPDSVEYIGEEAFADCRNLEEIQFPSHNIEICGSAFANTEWQNKHDDWVIVGDTIIGAGESFTLMLRESKTITIPKGVKSVADNVFNDLCQWAAEEIILPEGMESVSSAFGVYDDPYLPNILYGFVNLKKVVIPSSVKYIAEEAFWSESGLTICAPSGSYAEKYAKENNIPFEAK